MIAIDTNVLLRLLTRDDAAQAGKAQRAIEAAQAAGDSVLVNDIVLAETIWTLASRYAIDKPDLLRALRGLLDTATFAFESRSVLVEAVERYTTCAADFADCLITAKNAALNAQPTLTFDRAMRGLPAVRLL